MLTQKPERMDGYVRVSRRMGREGPGYISPDVQRDAIQRWADYRGVQIVAWHFDEDESGGTQNRPGLREALRRVEEGDTQGIACWRLNRFARNVSEALADVKRVQLAGGSLAFVEEDVDPTGPFGEFILTILLAVAALELNNLKAGWRTTKTRAVDRGAWIGPVPFGYRQRADGVLEPHPEEAPVVREAFRRAADDDLHAALDYLRTEAPRGTWTASTVRRLVSKRSYLGEVRYISEKPGEPRLVNPDAHEPLVSRALWERAQPEGPTPRRQKEPYPLSGIATCAACGEALVGGRGGPDNRRMYRCRASLALRKTARCQRPAVLSAEPLEAFVFDWLREHFAAAPGIEEYDPRANPEVNVDVALEALREAEAELEAFLGDLTLRRILGDRYHPEAERRVQAVEGTKAAYLAAEAAAGGQALVEPVEALEGLSPDRQAKALRGLGLVVEVTKGRGPLAGRVSIGLADEDAEAS